MSPVVKLLTRISSTLSKREKNAIVQILTDATPTRRGRKAKVKTKSKVTRKPRKAKETPVVKDATVTEPTPVGVVSATEIAPTV